MKIVNLDIAGNIRFYRKLNKLTLLELAIKTGLTKGLLSKIENGISENPTINTLLSISEALDVDLTTLIKKDESR